MLCRLGGEAKGVSALGLFRSDRIHHRMVCEKTTELEEGVVSVTTLTDLRAGCSGTFSMTCSGWWLVPRGRLRLGFAGAFEEPSILLWYFEGRGN